jgi:hypothetical protein
MGAIDYLKKHNLQAEALPGGRLSVQPKQNITPEVRAWIKQHKEQLLLELSPAPLVEIDTITTVLVDQVGRDLGPELVRRMRHAMAPMNRNDRAELAAALDDAFEVAGSVEAARWQCHRLLSDAKALKAAKAGWPAYPRGDA